MPPLILIVDDEKDLVQTLQYNLEITFVSRRGRALSVGLSKSF
jgi:hypothetical protein